MNALDNNKNTKKEPTTSQTTTIVKEIQKESPQENTSPNKENKTSQEKTQQEETPKSSVKEEKKKSRKQQLRTLLHLLQVNLPLKMKNSPILQLQKIKVINNQKNSFLPTLERSYFYCCNTFLGLVPSAGPMTPAISSSSMRRVARLNPTDKRR